jgi:hypothetical protein
MGWQVHPVPRSEFAGFRFPAEMIVLAVRWYLRFVLSYRDVGELLTERGIEIDHVSVFRCVQRVTANGRGSADLSTWGWPHTLRTHPLRRARSASHSRNDHPTVLVPVNPNFRHHKLSSKPSARDSEWLVHRVGEPHGLIIVHLNRESPWV